MTNEQRAAIAAKALLLVDDNLVGDLLADLMHYCNQKDISFEDELRTAYGHYDAELKGE